MFLISWIMWFLLCFMVLNINYDFCIIGFCIVVSLFLLRSFLVLMKLLLRKLFVVGLFWSWVFDEFEFVKCIWCDSLSNLIIFLLLLIVCYLLFILVEVDLWFGDSLKLLLLVWVEVFVELWLVNNWCNVFECNWLVFGW